MSVRRECLELIVQKEDEFSAIFCTEFQLELSFGGSNCLLFHFKIALIRLSLKAIFITTPLSLIGPEKKQGLSNYLPTFLYLPLFDQVVVGKGALVERSAAKTITKGGILIPEKFKEKYCQQLYQLVDSGSKGRGGKIQPVSMKVGNKVLPPRYRGTKVVLDDKDQFLFRGDA